MRILLPLFFAICAFAADAPNNAESTANNATAPQAQGNVVESAANNAPDATDSTAQNGANATDSTNAANNAESAQPTPEQAALSEDEKLKENIVTFDRVDYIKNPAAIQDPFIYYYPQSEEDLANILKAEQAVLVLNGIFEDKASINNIWVSKDDMVEGWTVSSIQKDRVELKFRASTKVLYVYKNDSGLKIK